jgi:hypothetical protein
LFVESSFSIQSNETNYKQIQKVAHFNELNFSFHSIIWNFISHHRWQYIWVSPKIPSRKMGLPLWSNWHTLPLYAKQLVGYWTVLSWAFLKSFKS